MDFNDLIGHELQKAKQILTENGYNNIEIIINSKKSELCDTCIVCAVQENNGKIILVCGDFYLNIER